MLKRADHDLPSASVDLAVEENTSSCRRRAMMSKYNSMPKRLIFDDAGVAHLEMKAVEEISGAGDAKKVALKAGRSFRWG